MDFEEELKKLNALIDHIEKLSASQNWVDVDCFLVDLEKGFKNIFDLINESSDINQKLVLKESGLMILGRMESLYHEMAVRKKEASLESKKIAAGRKGIRAYKNV